MKKRISLLIISLGILILVFNNAVFGTATIIKNDPVDKNYSSEQKANIRKVQERVESSWADLRTSFQIDDQGYFQLDISGLPDFTKGHSKIGDKTKIKTIMRDVINPYFDEVPLGSMLPLILIKNDGNKVLFCYKESDGTNVYKESTLSGDKWEKNERKLAGKLLIKIDKNIGDFRIID